MNRDKYEDILYLENDFEFAESLQKNLLGRATGLDFDSRNYSILRTKFLEDENTKKYLPDYIRTCRDINQFWQFIKNEFSTYAERRTFIYETFQDLLDYLETENIQGKKTTHLYYKDELKTIDDELDKLIQEAKERFHRTSDKQIALEKLWGAFERIKTFYGGKKNVSGDKLVELISTDFDRDFINDEFNRLTKIGNNYRIRHHEQNQIEIKDIKHIEYLFLRMLALLNLCLENIKIQDKSERIF